jgi:phosphoserine phosphatase
MTRPEESMKARVHAAALVAALTVCTMTHALDRMSWAPRNHAVLEKLIADNGRGTKDYDPELPPYAVFDWDYTSAFLDCEEALLRFQLWNMRFKQTPEEWKALFKDEIEGVKFATLNGQTVRLADVNADVVTHYATLRASEQSLETLRAKPEFMDLITKVAWLYEAYGETPGIGTKYSYPWLLFLLSGHTIPEVQALALEAIESNLADALEVRVWKGPRDLETRAGPVDHHCRSGLRVHSEMQDLMASLRAAGIDVYVVTASLKQVVEVFAGKSFGYHVPSLNVIGMELEIDDGRLRPVYKNGWVQTYKQGKVEAIKRRLAGRGDPILVGGDSDGDVAMATAFEGTKVSLILNRVRGGEVGELCKRAADQKSTRFLLQGRNENTGLFRPTEESILLGEQEPRLLK